MALLVQPTVGSLSDYTISRWGRRKPYILVGSLLDVVFLYGIAVSNTVVAIAAFVILLQFSSNFAQGPFQGYVPDLVPARQVGLASSLVGLMQILGQVAGLHDRLDRGRDPQLRRWHDGRSASLELVTMLSVVLRVDDGRSTKSRDGRSWLSIAPRGVGHGRPARAQLPVARRLAAALPDGWRAMLVILGAVLPAPDASGLDEAQSGTTFLIVVGLVLVANLLSRSSRPAGSRIGSAASALLYVSFGAGRRRDGDRDDRADPAASPTSAWSCSGSRRARSWPSTGR